MQAVSVSPRRRREGETQSTRVSDYCVPSRAGPSATTSIGPRSAASRRGVGGRGVRAESTRAADPIPRSARTPAVRSCMVPVGVAHSLDAPPTPPAVHAGRAAVHRGASRARGQGERVGGTGVTVGTCCT